MKFYTVVTCSMLVLYTNCGYVYIRGTTPLQGMDFNKINNFTPILQILMKLYTVVTCSMLVLYTNCDYVCMRGTIPLQGVHLNKINFSPI